MIRSRKTAVIAAAVVAAIAIAAFVVLRSRPSAALTAPPQPVIEFTQSDIYVVEAQALERTLPLTGSLSPLIEATLKAKVAGELVEVSAREGETVKSGQVLARIDQTEVRARVAAREADVQAARAQLVWADKNRGTQQALLDKKFISQNAFDNVQSNYDVAVAKLRAAEADLIMAKKSLGDSVLVAPFTGVVAQRHAQPGERIPLDAKIISVMDLSRLELEAAVPAAEIGKIRVGQQVKFQIDGFGARPFDGRIERINPGTTAGSRSISVYAVIDNPERVLRGGMFAQGAASLERIEGGLLIPVSAIREEAGQAYVYALGEGTVRRKAVKIGAADSAGRTQVLEGLASGERIVRNNLGALREGAAVKLAN
jgi:membrane fusion protein (multidrug efflux system)